MSRLGEKPKNLNEETPERADGLDVRTLVLVRFAAAIATGAGDATYLQLAADASAADVPAGDILGVLMEVGPEVGSSLLVSAAPRIARAIGHDIDAALEVHDGG